MKGENGNEGEIKVGDIKKKKVFKFKKAKRKRYKDKNASKNDSVERSTKKPKLQNGFNKIIPGQKKAYEARGPRWKTIKSPHSVTFSNKDVSSSFYSIEKLEGVELETKIVSNGKKQVIIKDRKGEEVKGLSSFLNSVATEDSELSDEISDIDSFIHVDQFSEKKTKKKITEPKEHNNKFSNEINFSEDKSIPTWSTLGLRSEIINVIVNLKYFQPTEIQKAVIPVALKKKHDVFAAAKTGSGKTLAFALPIIQQVLKNKENNSHSTGKECLSEKDNTTKLNRITALIIEPTRELSVQVSKVLKDLSTTLNVKVVTVTGGLSEDKQERIINENVDIVVATVGRLWSLIEKNDRFVAELFKIDYLVIDEADRMTEKGHFAELEKLINLIYNEHKRTKKTLTYKSIVMSATLETLKKKSALDKTLKVPNTLSNLFQRLKTCDKAPIYINQTIPSVIPDAVKQMILKCDEYRKDHYLYYILQKCLGKVIVFVNYIKKVNQLYTLLGFLKIKNVYQIHSEMKQEKRLKNVEIFEKNNNSVLISTDLASRGLDINNVQYIIHYNAPKTAETYVHRCGRTARMFALGVSVLFCSPEEYRFLHNKAVIPSKQLENLEDFDVNLKVLNALKCRVDPAKLLTDYHIKTRKMNSGKTWFEKTATSLDIDIDPEFITDKKDKKLIQKNTYPNSDDDDYSHKLESKKKKEILALKTLLDKSFSIKIDGINISR